jgi:octaprenyl-diphosphate synthase
MDADKRILEQYRAHFDRINEALEKTLNSRVALIQDIGNHTLLGRGKRLRPLIFVLSSKLFGCERKDIYALSTIFECIHTASLLHDDVLDNADMRRMQPSANQVWGNHAAVLEGDFLYSRSFCIAMQSESLRFLDTLTKTTAEMAQGQMIELVHTHDWEIGREKYFEIITAKTAVLISAACVCGAIVAGAEPRAVDLVGEFGLNMGIAFQLMDDLLDYTSSETVVGKPVGKDLREGKITLPLILTLLRLGNDEKTGLSDRFAPGQAAEPDYRYLIDLVRASGAVEEVRQEAKQYAVRAGRCLEPFPESAAKESLLQINDYIVQRKR